MRREFSIGLVALAMSLATASMVVAQDKVGVEPCDRFLAKYEACVAAKVPAAAQTPQLKDAIRQMRLMWVSLAADPVTKDRVPALCQQALETTKQQTVALGCGW